MVSMVTQIMLGLLLLFGTITLAPRGIYYLRVRSRGRGILYLLLSLASTLFAVLSFHYAYLSFVVHWNP